MSLLSDIYYHLLSFLRTKERARISIIEKKPGVVWIIVCDAQATDEPSSTPATYAAHWTGDGWETSDGDDYHVYTSMKTAESYLNDDLRQMLGMLPRRNAD